MASLEESIDFADIPNQIRRSLNSRVWEFNLMLVGESGIGKSTLVKSLFQGKVIPVETDGSVTDKYINEYDAMLEDASNVKLKLKCIETSGYCSNYFDNKSHEPFVNYIEQQFDKYFIAEYSHVRSAIPDTRVHCCIYFIRPYGRHLRQVDIDCMKALHEKVNLVPIIANADHLTAQQLDEFKENLLKDFEQHNIKYYQFLNQETRGLNDEIDKFIDENHKKFPFAIIASDGCDAKGEWIRVMPWGTIKIKDEKHCDFSVFRQLLIRFCMLDLMDNTHCEHYARYKSRIQ